MGFDLVNGDLAQADLKFIICFQLLLLIPSFKYLFSLGAILRPGKIRLLWGRMEIKFFSLHKNLIVRK